MSHRADGHGPGDPGYRTRLGASGLDPLDTWLKLGRVTGLLLKLTLGRRLASFSGLLVVVMVGLGGLVEAGGLVLFFLGGAHFLRAMRSSRSHQTPLPSTRS